VTHLPFLALRDGKTLQIRCPCKKAIKLGKAPRFPGFSIASGIIGPQCDDSREAYRTEGSYLARSSTYGRAIAINAGKDPQMPAGVGPLHGLASTHALLARPPILMSMFDSGEKV
jgi:hypothetical protein